MEQRTNIVDAVKLFFAVCIIAMHTSLLNQFSEPVYWYVMHLLFRLAVPFFFVASGFFLGKKMLPIADNREKRIAVCIQYAKKLIPSFLFWSTIGLIWYTITLIRSRVPHIPLKVIQTAIFYPQGAMWFVSASIFAVLAIGQLWNYKKLLIFTCMGGVYLCLNL